MTCDTCGSEMDKDCQGNERCEMCDGPCLCCYDGGMDDYGVVFDFDNAQSR